MTQGQITRGLGPCQVTRGATQTLLHVIGRAGQSINSPLAESRPMGILPARVGAPLARWMTTEER
jgi:hypothetical protein